MFKKTIFSVLGLSLLIAGCSDGKIDSSKLNSLNSTSSSSVPTVTSVKVSQAPTLVVTPGEDLSLSGGKIELTHSDQSKKTLDLLSSYITSIDYFAKEVKIDYQGKTDTASITVPGTYVSDNDELAEALSSQANLILIKEGVYETQMIVEKNCVIVGEGRDKVTISGPKADENFVQIEKLEGELYDYGGIVALKDATVSLLDLTIKPDEAKVNRASKLGGTSRACGIAIINSKALIKRVSILDVTFEENLKGMQNGFGVYGVATDSGKWIKIIESRIENFNKCAVLTRVGIEELTVEKCTIIGFGDSPRIAQNGIQYSNIVKIISTYFEGMSYTGENYSSCAILRAKVVDVEWENCVFANNQFENVDIEHGGID